MKRLTTRACAACLARHGGDGPFFSLVNTNFVVLLGFLVFVGLLVYLKVPGKLTAMLDARAVAHQGRPGRSPRPAGRGQVDPGHPTSASQKEVQEQADRIVARPGKRRWPRQRRPRPICKASIARRLAAATDQIASAEAAAIRQVREQAVSVAIAAAGDVLAKQMTAEAAATSIDDAIAQVAAKLH